MHAGSNITLPGDYHKFLDSTELLSANYYRFSRPPVQFGRVFRNELLNADNIDIYLNANVSRIDLHESGENVAGVKFSTFSGLQHTVRAKYYILATGAVENARLLLLSDDIQQKGVGNKHDNVGRYFMEHAEYDNTGNCMLYETSDLFDWHKLREKDGRLFEPVLCLTPKAQEKYKLLNAAIQLYPYSDNEVSREFRKYHQLFSAFDAMRRGTNQQNQDLTAIRISIKSELEPRRDSRVELSSDVDELGLRKAQLTYTVSVLNSRTVENCFTLLSNELTRLSKGRVEVFFDPDDVEKTYQYGSHHMGSTRMGSDPKTSVVDKNCRVHGVDNLYVAGSSVFPTSGYATPTFTIVALALRLSDHVSARMNANA